MLRPFHGAVTDLRMGLRRLAATPLFTVFAVLSLAVGVGVTTAVYSVVESLFLKNLGILNPERLAFVVTPYEGRLLKGSISRPDFDDFRGAQRSFNSVSASLAFEPAVALSSSTELLSAEAVDGDYFATLGVGPAIGRAIQSSDRGANARVVVLSHKLWRRRFGGNPAAVGQTVRIAGNVFEVIGVAPRSFDGVNGAVPGTKLWIPLDAESLALRTPASSRPADRNRRVLRVFGRLASGVTIPAASGELSAIAAALDTAYPPPSRAPHASASERPWKLKSAAAVESDDTFVRRFGLMLIGLVGLVLVVACTNLANLVLARGAARRQELVIRHALGASRWRLVREQCAESLILAFGGAAGALVVFQGLRVLMDVEYNLSLPMGGRWTLATRPELNMPAAALAAASLLLSLIVFGLEPALQLTRTADLRRDLTTGAGRPGGRQGALLRWQVAISAGFFVIATMFVRYTVAEARHEPGVDLARLAVAVLSVNGPDWGEPRVRRTLDRVLQDAGTDPAIAGIAAGTGLPFGTPGQFRVSLSPSDAVGVDAAGARTTTGIAVTPAMFATLGVTVLQGRGFDERDSATAAPVVMLSALAAQGLFGSGDAVGRTVQVRGRPSGVTLATVVGIARDTDVRMILRERRPLVYFPFSQRYEPALTIAARASGGTAPALQALRRVLRTAAPDMAIDVIGSGRDVLSGPFVLLRSAGLTALGLGVVTLLLAMAGLFGIQSHIVARRTREIGVRLALGATAAQIRRMVLRDGCAPVVEGLAIGLFIGVAGRAIVRAYMEIDTSVVDPWMLVVVPVPMLLSAWCACYIPANRAACVEPNVALRCA
ncbi:MAG: ABC transporter permease [Vicinamibacterales bacterium]